MHAREDRSLLPPLVPQADGFQQDNAGVHDSRTIMLAELRTLLAAMSPAAGAAAYRAAVLQDNLLLKPSSATRRASFRRLRELYALDPGVTLFRALRRLWPANPDAQPLLALLCAVARDAVLRASADPVLALPPGSPVTPQQLAVAVAEAFPGRFNDLVAARVGRNLASSWRQSGHLRGHRQKVRGLAVACPASLAYALLLGHLCGARGEALFGTLWARLLDTPRPRLEALAAEASRLGWLEYRSGGGVTEVTFSHLLAPDPTEGSP